MLHADFRSGPRRRRCCAPIVTTGPLLAAAREALLGRAVALGHALTDQPDLRLVTVGWVLEPRLVHGRLSFRLPPRARRLRLESRSFVPALVTPDGTDRRRLGVAVAQLLLDGAPITLDGPLLIAGWHEPEPGLRWTNGRAELAIPKGSRLDVELARTGRYWTDDVAIAG
jgi:hypothetical protein